MTTDQPLAPVTQGTPLTSPVGVRGMEATTYMDTDGTHLVRMQIVLVGQEPAFVYMTPDAAVTFAQNILRRARIAQGMNQPAPVV